MKNNLTIINLNDLFIDLNHILMKRNILEGIDESVSIIDNAIEDSLEYYIIL